MDLSQTTTVNIVGIPWLPIDRASDNLREEYFNRKVPTHIEEIPLVFRMTQREGNVRKSDARFSSRGIACICRRQCHQMFTNLHYFHVRELLREIHEILEIECNYDVVNFLSLLYACGILLDFNIFFGEGGERRKAPLLFTWDSVHGFQTNDSMLVPEIHLMRTVAWLIRRKGEPSRLIIWRKPETILLPAIKLKTEQYYDKERNIARYVT